VGGFAATGLGWGFPAGANPALGAAFALAALAVGVVPRDAVGLDTVWAVPQSPLPQSDVDAEAFCTQAVMDYFSSSRSCPCKGPRGDQ
jgi:hypothetical protein